jgi:hypothetical protein
MKKLLMAAALAGSLALAGVADAATTTISGLFNTGVDNTGTVTTGNGADAHWKLAGVGLDSGYGPAAYTSGQNGVWPIGPWIAEDANSRWLTPSPVILDTLDQQPNPDGYYQYSLTFTLPEFSAASFSGRFAADNDVTNITLNGHDLTQPGVPIGGFTDWTDFGASTSDFQQGSNKLTFTVRNWAWTSANPSGFRAEFTGSRLAPVPEPASWALMILGFGSVGAMVRRRRMATVVA